MTTSPKVQKSSISEIWKPIKGYEGLYECSNLGRIKRLETKARHNYGGLMTLKEHIVKGTIGNGNRKHNLSKDGKNKSVATAKIIAQNFLEKPKGAIRVWHKDGNQLNNRAENLEWHVSRESKRKMKKVEPLQLEGEIWKPIEGHQGMYEISNLGRVKVSERLRKSGWGTMFKDKEKIIKTPLSAGYRVARLFCKHKKQDSILVHRLVAIAFIPNPENKPQINHIDGNKLNNSISNLEWCTPKENSVHARETGLHDYKGEKHHLTPFTKKEILSIREEYKDPNTSHRDLARKYGVEKTTIGNIIRRKTWKHV